MFRLFEKHVFIYFKNKIKEVPGSITYNANPLLISESFQIQTESEIDLPDCAFSFYYH